MLYPETIWRIPVPGKEKNIYLTFDDGPIPEVTPWVLNLLDHYQVKATFFCVGENVARNRELYEEIKLRGHSTGNHTMNHIQGIIMWDVVTRDYSKKLNGEDVFNNVKKFVRNGSIIVFHDSLKSQKNLRYALPKSIEWLLEKGYNFERIFP